MPIQWGKEASTADKDWLPSAESMLNIAKVSLCTGAFVQVSFYKSGGMRLSSYYKGQKGDAKVTTDTEIDDWVQEFLRYADIPDRIISAMWPN